MLNKYFPSLNAAANNLYRSLKLYFSNRSWRAWRQLFRHFLLKLSGRNSPALIQIGVTYQCQCRCLHCYADAPRKEDRDVLKLQEIKSVIDQAVNIGVLQVIFTGGEPLMRKDLPEMVRYARKSGLITRINSNGWMLDPKYVVNLKKAGLTQCHVSIDSADPVIHDRRRGLDGLQAKALQGIRYLKQCGILVQILTVATKSNIGQGLKDIIALGRDLGVMCVYIVFPVASGRYDHSPDQLLNEEDRSRVRALQDITHVHLELPTPRTECSVTSKSAFFVSPYGDVTSCPPVPYTIGSVRNHSLRFLWERLCSNLTFSFRGDCPMNHPASRRALKEHVNTMRAESP